MAHFSPFFTFFQLRSSGYAPSKMQKLTKISLFLPPAENPEQALKPAFDLPYIIKYIGPGQFLTDPGFFNVKKC
ncbi:MAG: hypothetical protein ACK5FV_04260 [Bacteroidota bacterium]